MPIPINSGTSLLAVVSALGRETKHGDYVQLSAQATLGLTRTLPHRMDQDANALRAKLRSILEDLVQRSLLTGALGTQSTPGEHSATRLRELASAAVSHVLREKEPLRIKSLCNLSKAVERMAADRKGEFGAYVSGKSDHDDEGTAQSLVKNAFRAAKAESQESPAPAKPAKPAERRCNPCDRMTSVLTAIGTGFFAYVSNTWDDLGHQTLGAACVLGPFIRLESQKLNGKDQQLPPQATWSREQVHATLGSLFGLLTPKLAFLTMEDTVRLWHAIRSDPSSAAAAVDMVGEAMDRIPEWDFDKWAAIACVLLEVHKDTLRHVYLSTHELAGVDKGIIHALGRIGGVPKGNWHAVSLSPQQFSDDTRAPGVGIDSPLRKKWDLHFNILAQNCDRLTRFLQSDMAHDDAWALHPLDEVIEHFEAFEDRRLAQERQDVLVPPIPDSKNTEPATLEQAPKDRGTDPPRPGGFAPESEHESGKPEHRRWRDSMTATPGPSSASSTSTTTSSSVSGGKPTQRRRIDRKMPSYPPTGRGHRTTSHHDIGKAKWLSKEERDLAGRPGKSWNHKLAVDRSRDRHG